MFRWFVFVFICSIFYQVLGVNNCVCVPFWQCENNKIIVDGRKIIVPRDKPTKTISLQPGLCTTSLEICCQVPNTTFYFENIPKRQCGIRNPNGVGHSITDNFKNEAQFAEFPWMIAVLFKNSSSSSYEFNSGGSLINEKVVLTAAHSVQKTGGHYQIRAGEWDSQTTKEIFRHKDINVSRVVIHPDYDSTHLYNNIALLFLEKNVERKAHHNFICLPSQDFVSTDNDCIVTGWGKKEFGQHAAYQTILKQIELPVMPRRECLEAFRSSRLGFTFDLHDSVMCAGGKSGLDACTGDGGGPLVCPIKGKINEYQQVGIVSWGIGCGSSGVPGAYVDVAKFRDWIDEEVRSRNLDSSTYEFKP